MIGDAYIELANYRVSDEQRRKLRKHPLDKSLLIAKLRNMQHVQMFTLTSPISSTTGGGGAQPTVHIVRFEEAFRLANGVTLPKVIGCLGSDGL
jgi:hypothetical protein